MISPPFSKFLMCYYLVVIIPSQLCILQYGIGVLSYPLCFSMQCVLLGEGNGTPLQYSCLENPTDGGA